MRLLSLVSLFIFIAGSTAAQENSFQCPCSKIGLSESWADSNKVTCYLVPVNRAYNQPAGGKHVLAVAKAFSQNNTKELPLLYLHGGPGIATLGNLPSYLGSSTWKLIREKHDLLFFDYRGTGASEPALCNGLSDSLSAFARSKHSTDEIKTREVMLYKHCRDNLSRQGIDLATFSSFQFAADAEEIRKALKIDTWNVYGVSYGTTVALNIIRSFPGNLHAVILDSPFPPNAPWLDFVRPFDTCFKVLQNKLMQDPATALQFANLKTDFGRAVERLNAHPVKLLPPGSKDTNFKYSYTGNDFAWSIWSAMLKPKTIPFVPLAIQEVANGNDAILQLWSTAFSSPDAHGKFSPAQSNAILCYEGKPQKTEDTEEALLKNYPEFSSFNSGFNIPVCNAWRPDTPSKNIFDPVVSDIPVLILAGEFDPVCPPFFGELTAKTLSRSRFINVPGASHAAISTDECIRNIAIDFISSPSRHVNADCLTRRNKTVFHKKDLYGNLKVYTK